jgi:dipicolinate synthase subunit A
VGTIIVVGTGSRETALREGLTRAGHQVWSWKEAASTPVSGWPRGGWIIAPLATVDEGGGLPELGIRHALSPEALHRLGPGGVLAAGRVAPPVQGWAEEARVEVVALTELEVFRWLNAVPTAEGAIREAMGLDLLPLAGRRTAVMGFGHVGSVLALRLKAYGCGVRVLDARSSARAWAEAMGLEARPLAPHHLQGCELVFNTIPVAVVDESWMEQLTGAWYLELASAPGAVPPTLRDRLHYRALPGLPGTLAPRRAAEIVWRSILTALAERGVEGLPSPELQFGGVAEGAWGGRLQ